MTRELPVDGRTIHLESGAIFLAYPVRAAVQIDDLVLVLYDPGALKQKFGVFENLAGFSLDGSVRSVAQLPSSTTGDRYVDLTVGDQIVAYSWSGFNCVIDIRSGRIVSAEFLK
jgi:hypothetical protein